VLPAEKNSRFPNARAPRLMETVARKECKILVFWFRNINRNGSCPAAPSTVMGSPPRTHALDYNTL
jgi:hypothetical protein